MKKLLIVSLTTTFTVGLFSCKTTKTQIDQAPVTAVDTIIETSLKKIVRNKDIYSATTDAIKLDTAYIHQDTLILRTAKVSACDAEEFDLIANGMFTRSLPPQTGLKLFHRFDTECKEAHLFEMSFDLHNIQMKQPRSLDTVYVPGNKTIVIRLSGWESPLRYDYKEKEKKSLD